MPSGIRTAACEYRLKCNENISRTAFVRAIDVNRNRDWTLIAPAQARLAGFPTSEKSRNHRT
jgi:hypothetical protein